MLARRAFATAAYRLLECVAVNLDVRSDQQVVNGNTGVLAQQVVRIFRHLDIRHHGGQHALRSRCSFSLGQTGQSRLDIRRQHFQCADVQRHCGLLHRL